jgi:PA domain
VRNEILMAALVLAASARDASATSFAIDNVNATGIGFNDVTPATPIGGNSGTTLGQQRLIVFQQAANQWGRLLNSGITIKVQASMVPLNCTATSATLGSAGALATAAAFPGAPRALTSYNIAEANALAGTDLDPTQDDISAQFNVSLDAGDMNCLGGTKWWYGIDPSIAPVGNTTALLPVVFHELGHGLGFTANVNSSTGAFLTPDPPVWASYLFDTQTNKLWSAMTNGERAASSINDPHLVWTGPRTNKQAGGYLKPGNSLIVNSPAGIAGAQEVGFAQFGPQPPANGVTANIVLVNDGTGTTTDGCEAITNGAALTGKIALIDRGTCSFIIKVKNAQNAGAIAAVIVNNAVDPIGLPLLMSGTDPTITIPTYSTTQAFGATIESSGTVNATLGYANIGVNQGCVRMFAPNPLVQGSSVSHFHADASPDLLMEPALNITIFNHVDLTLPLFADIDWSVNNIDDLLFFDGFDANPCQHVQP